MDDGDEEAIQPDWLPFPVKPASLSKLCTCVLGGRIPAKATEYVTGAMTTVTATSHFTTITLQAPRSIVMATGTTTLTTTTHTVHEVPTTTLTETVSTTTVVVQPAPTFCGEVGHFAVDPMSTDNIYRHANVNEYDCLDICRLNNGCRCAVWSAGSDVYHLPKQCVLYNEYCEELYSSEDLGYIELNGRLSFWSKDCKH